METIYVVLWIVSGVFAYGLSFAWAQKSLPMFAKKRRRLDRIFAAVAFVLGPVGLVLVLVLCGWGYGLLFRSLSDVELLGEEMRMLRKEFGDGDDS